MNEQEILDEILIADGYLLTIQEEKLLEYYKGCSGASENAKQAQIIMLKEQLLYKISIEDYGEETEHLYSCLLKAVETYSGASISIDPNSNTPGTVIIVPTPEIPQWIDIPWNDLESEDEDANGARYTFRAPWLLGWNPAGFIQGGTQLVLDGSLPVDDATPNYNMYTDGTNGVFRLKEGFGIYDGSYIRFVNYNSYIAPPLPVDDPPVIVFQPDTPINKVVGQNFSMYIFATNATGYQWYKNGVPISGQTSDTFFKSGAQVVDSGTYKVRVSNASAYVDSIDVIVSVITGNYVRNNSNEKSDGTPNGSGRNITVIIDNVGTSTFGAGSFTGPFPKENINIHQNGANSLTLVCGAFSAPILNGNVDNIFDISTFTNSDIFVYNNN